MTGNEALEAAAALVEGEDHPIGFMTAEERHVIRMAQKALAEKVRALKTPEPAQAKTETQLRLTLDIPLMVYHSRDEGQLRLQIQEYIARVLNRDGDRPLCFYGEQFRHSLGLVVAGINRFGHPAQDDGSPVSAHVSTDPLHPDGFTDKFRVTVTQTPKGSLP